MLGPMSFARLLWSRLETLHAVTYFGEETQIAARDLGASGFWMGYFGLRAAPLGRPTAATVDATFANFAPAFVRRWVPDVWDRVDPMQAVVVRAGAAARTLRRTTDLSDETARSLAEQLHPAIGAADALGRPLFAANRDLPEPDDPLAALWQACTTLREHRGDGHLISLASAGVGGLDAHVLLTLDHGTDPAHLKRARGWTDDDWEAAVDRCRARGWADGSGLTPAGRDLRTNIEQRTDELAMDALGHLHEDARVQLLDALTAPAAAIATSGLLPYPNPIGLPPIEQADRAS